MIVIKKKLEVSIYWDISLRLQEDQTSKLFIKILIRALQIGIHFTSQTERMNDGL